MLSIILPARNEIFLNRTIQDLLEKATGEIEIIAVLDGYWPSETKREHWSTPALIEDPRVIYLHHGEAKGMRQSINDGVAVARGKFIMKLDAHCLVGKGFDEILQADCEENWVVIPRRHRLDAEHWEINKDRPGAIDYLYVCYPDNPNDFGGPTLTGREWQEKNRDKALREKEIDELMTFQGSCWFMHRKYFYELGELDTEAYGTFGKEPQEIGFKAWLGGGKVMRNKKTWYAHLHKGRKYGRGYSLGKNMLHKGGKAINRWLVFKKAWDKQKFDLKWLIDRFAPVPGWEKCDWSDEAWKESLSRDDTIQAPTQAPISFFGKRGGSFEIRGKQVAEKLNAKVNPIQYPPTDLSIYVKAEPDKIFNNNSWLDVIDAPERLDWLKRHPNMNVIASSKIQFETLMKELPEHKIAFIPQHHCNYERYVRRKNGTPRVVGVVGGKGAIEDYAIEDLKQMFEKIGMEFKWFQDFKTRKDVVDAYRELDIQVIWRPRYAPDDKHKKLAYMKNGLKLVNAMSFGIPTVAYPEIGLRSEFDGYFLPATKFSDLISLVRSLKGSQVLYNVFAQRGLEKANEYHINHISKLYLGLQ